MSVDPGATRTTSGDEPAATGTVAGDGAPASAPRTVGPWRIESEIGHGGMGTVYLARRADAEFDKLVALKLIRSGADDEAVRRHFRRERQILARLEHPNVARFLDGGTTEDGRPYFVMEYVPGEPLLQYCDERELEIEERLRLFRQVCGAVAYAHRNLIVHRDLKPGNVVVGADGTPKLLDFGIARLLEAAPGEGTGTALEMTPEYASPEQVNGEAVTTASDVYSLGVILYELLTGQRPYRLKSRATGEVLRAVVEQEPESPSAVVTRPWTVPGTDRVATPELLAGARHAAPERLRRRLRGDLDNIVLKALRKEPSQRYGSVEALADDVGRVLSGHPISARPATLAYRARKFVRRNRIAVAVSALLALAVLASGVALARQAQSLRAALRTAESERARAERVAQFVVSLFKVNNPDQARGATITAREVLDRSRTRIDAELRDHPETRALLMRTMASVYTNLGLHAEARPLYEDVVRTQIALKGPQDPDTALDMSHLAGVLVDDGAFEPAVALYRQVLAAQAAALGDEHVDTLATHNDLAIALESLGRLDEARAHYRTALDGQVRILGELNRTTAQTRNNLAGVLYAERDLRGAEQMFREVAAVFRRLDGDDHPRTLMAASNLATVLAEQERFAEAEPLARDVLERRRRILGPRHPDVATTLAVLAEIEEGRGDLAAAEAAQREVLALRRAIQGDDHLDVAESRTALAGLLATLGRKDEARREVEESLRILRRTFPDGHPMIDEAERVRARLR